MKYIRYIVIIIITFLINISIVYAGTSFKPDVYVDENIVDKKIKIYLGFTGEEQMIIKQSFSYKSESLKLSDVVALDNFNVEFNDTETDSNWRTVNIISDSDYSFNDTNYAYIEFEIIGDYSTGDKLDLFTYNYESMGPSGVKYSFPGKFIEVTRDSHDYLDFEMTDIDKDTKFNYWLKRTKVITIVFVILFIAIVALLIWLAYKAKEKKLMQAVHEREMEELARQEQKEFLYKIDDQQIQNINNFEQSNYYYDDADYTNNVITNNNVSDSNSFIESDVQISEERHEENYISAFSMSPVNEDSLNNSVVETFDDFVDISDTETKNDNSTNIFGIIISLLLMGSMFFTGNINAEELTTQEVTTQNVQSETDSDQEQSIAYDVNGLRKHIVNNKKYDKKYDYNNDGKVDIGDLLATKDTSNCSFEEKMNSDPVFKELQHNSNNSTLRKKQVKKASKTSKTTKKASTTKKSTSKKSTTKKVTTKKVTTKAQPKSYEVKISVDNGTSDVSSIIIDSHSSKTININPINGYGSPVVTCSKVAGSLSGNTLILKNPTSNDATCKVTFKARTDIKVNVDVFYDYSGGASSYSYTKSNEYKGTYQKSKTIKFDNPDLGFELKSYSCNNDSITSPVIGKGRNDASITFNTDDSCKVVLIPKKYKVTEMLNNKVVKEMYIQYGVNYTFTISPTRINKVYCNNLPQTLTGGEVSPGSYSYSFDYTIKSDTVCKIQ